MGWLVVLVLVALICFAAVITVGAPYLPTLRPQVESALDIAALQQGETLLELGCGDGRVCMAAAERGLNVIGYELNPILAMICWLRTRRYRGRVKVIWGNFWRRPWPKAEAIFVFLLPKYMPRLDTRVMHYKHKPVKLVSFAFSIPGKHATTVRSGIFLYRYK